MSYIRAALLTALLGLLALLLAWSFRERLTAVRAGKATEAAEGAKKSAPPRARDFPRQPAPDDAVFVDPPADGAADIEHPWAGYLRVCAEVKAKLMATQVELDCTNVTLTEILALIEQQLGMKLNVDVPAEIAGKQISFAVKDLAAQHVIRLLLQQYDCRLVTSGDGMLWAVVASDAASVYEPSFIGELRDLQHLSGDLIAERAANPDVERNREAAKALGAIHISLNMNETPLPEFISFIQEVTQLNMMIDRRQLPDELADTPITCRFDDQLLEKALTDTLTSNGLGFRIDGGVLVVTTKRDLERRRENAEKAVETKRLVREVEQDLFCRPVAFGAENLRLREVAEILAKGLGVPYSIDPGTWSSRARFTIEKRQRPASGIVALLHKGASVIIVYRNGVLWFLSPEGVK